MKTLFQWLTLLLIATGIYFGVKYISLPVMPGYLVLLFSLSLAFAWVEKFKIGVIKPFNCFGCMTGWFSLIIAFGFHTTFWYFYLPAGLMAGSLFTAIKGRL